MKATISLVVENDNKEEMANIVASYTGLDYAHVVDMEDKLVNGVFVPLLDIAKEKAAA